MMRRISSELRHNEPRFSSQLVRLCPLVAVPDSSVKGSDRPTELRLAVRAVAVPDGIPGVGDGQGAPRHQRSGGALVQRGKELAGLGHSHARLLLDETDGSKGILVGLQQANPGDETASSELRRNLFPEEPPTLDGVAEPHRRLQRKAGQRTQFLDHFDFGGLRQQFGDIQRQ